MRTRVAVLGMLLKTMPEAGTGFPRTLLWALIFLTSPTLIGGNDADDMPPFR
jgi:hypothetical protein